MNTLALDPGGKTGWAFCDSQMNLESGTWSCYRKEYGRLSFEPAMDLYWLLTSESRLRLQRGDLVAFEHNPGAKGFAKHRLLTMEMMVVAFCRFNQVTFRRVGNTEWKKKCCGRARVKPDEYLELAKGYWPHVETADEAAALFILQFVNWATARLTS